MSNSLLILLYHDIESDDFPNEKVDAATAATVVRLPEFERQMAWLNQNGYHCLSLDDGLQALRNQICLPAKAVAITFDDGHWSNYHLALPVLRQYGFKATFFIIADRINRRYYLSRDQIREMAAEGMEIGSHGLTHEHLPLLKEDEIRMELVESKRIIEVAARAEVRFFAFSGGHYNRAVLRMLPQCGYEGACSCWQGLNTRRTSPYLLRRMEIRRGVRIEGFGKVFDLQRIRMGQMIDWFKAGVRQTVGLRNYRRLRSRFFRFYPFQR